VKWFSILPGLFLGYNHDVSSILFPWSLWRTECWFPNLLVKHKQDASLSFLFLLFEIVAYKELELNWYHLIVDSWYFNLCTLDNPILENNRISKSLVFALVR
jgi:hypothetical protein